MNYWQLFLNDIFYSPIVYHLIGLMISTIKVIWVKCFSRYMYESEYWGTTLMVLMFFNPFLAFFAHSFWVVWLQTLILSIPLCGLDYFYRQYILRVGNDNGAGMAIMGAVFVGAYGQIASGIIALIIYICKVVLNWI